MCPQRFNPKHIAEYKRELGSYGYAGQYQQRPSPADGGIFKKSWFPWWKSPEVPPLYGVVQSWDTAYSEKPTSDYSACTTWGLWKDNHDVDNMVLLGIWRGRVEYHELLKRAKRLHFDYRDTDKEKNPALKGREVHICLIEATGFGDQLIRDLTVAGIAPTPYHPKKHGDKIRRAHLVSPLIEDGRVWLPAQPPHYTTLLPFAQELEHYAILFPRSDSRDVIDTLTQALIHLRNGFNIGLKEDQEDDDPLPPTKPMKAY
ncbi:terminase-like family protein [Caedimonas varicaedens]|uniref:Terminase-like family protein n=1 Tax=Caedimonas varicaedens TaxID=1629334 RepID=A0A0K8MFJ5_9PROT|nr:terminase-like family protein [Caedimonas varicaedens]